MTFQESIEELGDNTARVVLQLWDSHLAGDIDRATFEELTAQLVATSNGRAWTLGAVALAGYLTAITGEPGTVALPIPAHRIDTGRLQRAVRTVVTEMDEPGVTIVSGERLTELEEQGRQRAAARRRLDRLGRSEPMETAQRGYSDALAADERVEGWVRRHESEPCELCTWWTFDGRVWPKDHTMPTHKGCVCMPVPVLTDRVPRVSDDAGWSSAERAAAGGPEATRDMHPTEYSRDARYRTRLREEQRELQQRPRTTAEAER